MIDPALERPVAGAAIDETLFVAWSPDGDYGMLSGHRLLGRRAWYWTAFVHHGHPLLHLAEFEVKVRPDKHVVKAPEMWAEHYCDEPMRQWSIGNEAYFAELDSPDDALGRAYGVPRPTGFDLEWYAIGGAVERSDGYEQAGVVHGIVEVMGRETLDVAEIPAYRWRRWTSAHHLGPVEVPPVRAHTGLRAPFKFPDGTVTDWVVTPAGWRARGGGEAR